MDSLSLPAAARDAAILTDASEWVEARKTRVEAVRDDLAAAKVRQAAQAKKKRAPDPPYAVGDPVMVDTTGRRAKYKSAGRDVRAAKMFMRWDGPFDIIEVFPDTSTVRVALPDGDRAHPVFHLSKIKPYRKNDTELAPNREPPRPGPIDVDGVAEHLVEAIVDEKYEGNRRQYFVKWVGWPEPTWEPRENVEDTEALDAWEAREVDGLGQV